MKFLKHLGFSILIVVFLFVIFINFSIIETKFECSGNLSKNENSEPETIYLVLEKYRWWVVWGNSDGTLMLEIPNTTLQYFSRVAEAGSQLHIFNPEESLKGSFSTVSRALSIKTHYGFFDGKCHAIE